MNIRNIAIVVTIVVLMLSVALSMFFRELVNLNAPSEITAGTESVEKAGENIFEIPANAVPKVGRIEEDLNNAEALRAASAEVIAKMNKEKAIARSQIVEEALAADKAAMSVSRSKEKEAPAETTKKVIKNPTREEREKMRAGGIIAF